MIRGLSFLSKNTAQYITLSFGAPSPERDST
jgi:hypothetical protein